MDSSLFRIEVIKATDFHYRRYPLSAFWRTDVHGYMEGNGGIG